MKKTLITLAALAASVASAATLDLTSNTLPSSITFAGDGSDVITLNSTIAVSPVTDTNGSAIGGVTILNKDGNAADLFYHESGSRNAAFVGGTINFGTNGRLDVAQPDGAVNLNTMGLVFTAVLDLVVETDDATLLAAGQGLVTRTLMTSTNGGLWHRGMSGNSYTFSATALEAGMTVTNTTADANQWGLSKTLTDSDTIGSYQIYNAGDDDISLAYVVKYVAATTPDAPAVPEPATATLSLLALAGLAARRRRK